MSKEQLKKEFIKAYTDNRWKMPMTESLGKLFDVYYSKLQEKDRIQFNALLKWHEERHKLKGMLKFEGESNIAKSFTNALLKIKNLETKLAEHKLTENASEFLDEYRAMKKQLAKEKELRQAAEKVIKALTDRIMPQEYQKLKI